MRIIHALWICLLVSLFPGFAAAQTVYSLDNTAVGAFDTGPFGSVTLTQSSNNVLVSVALRSDLNFVDTGSHSIFSFNLGGASSSNDITGISFASGLGASFSVASNATNSPFGTFTYGINCDENCKKGGSGGGYVDPLNFTVLQASIADFRQLSSGGTSAYFAADVINLSGNTGTIGATVAAVPEPESYAMMLGGLGLIGFVARRRQRK
ncbi:MAG: PEPxxWA-CTERM sorting domain-containing protein [Rhodoferax sp.]